MTARTLRVGSAAYDAAILIHHGGPLHRSALFALVDFGATHNRNNTLDAAIDAGWLTETLNGVALTIRAEHFLGDAGIAKKAEPYVGQVAGPRTPLVSVWDVKPISKQHIPNRHGTRDDVPAFSVRTDVRHYSVMVKT